MKNEALQKIRKRISPEVKRMVDLSFGIAGRMDVLRQQKGITQRQLAELLGKRDSEISKWMRGTHNFTIKTIARLECVLGEPLLEITRSTQARKSKVTRLQK